jgi:ABC-type spermidine/putrescine transport system permease subunit I
MLTLLRRHSAWPAVPLVLLFLVAYLYPLGRMLFDAFTSPDLGPNVSHALEAPIYTAVLGRTLQIAILVALVTVVIAYPLAAFVAARPRRQRVVLIALLFAPLLTSVVVRTYVWVTILRPNGVIDGIGTALGLPILDGALYQNDIAVLIGMVHLMTPFAALPLYAGFARLDPDLRRAAASLGAGYVSQWRRIVLPLTLPTVLAASVLVFVTTLGFVITPQILGGPRGVMLGVLVAREMALNNVSFAALLSATLLVATILALIVLRVFVAAFRRRGLV